MATLSQLIARTKGLIGEQQAEELIGLLLEAMQKQPINDLMGEKEAADFLGVTQGTLQVWRSTGRYAIPFVKVGRLVKYRRSSLQQWIESRTRLSGATE